MAAATRHGPFVRLPKAAGIPDPGCYFSPPSISPRVPVIPCLCLSFDLLLPRLHLEFYRFSFSSCGLACGCYHHHLRLLRSIICRTNNVANSGNRPQVAQPDTKLEAIKKRHTPVILLGKLHIPVSEITQRRKTEQSEAYMKAAVQVSGSVHRPSSHGGVRYPTTTASFLVSDLLLFPAKSEG